MTSIWELPNIYFKICSSSTIHPTITFNLKCISVHSHAHPLSKNWLSQHIPKKQIPNWRKWPQFVSCQTYIFKMYSSPAIQWRTTFNLKCIFVHSHAHPLSKNWLSQHIPKNRFQIDANDLNLNELPNVYFQNLLLINNTPDNQPQMHIFNLKCISVHSHAHSLSKNCLSQHIPKKQIPNWRKWPQFVSCQTYIFKMYSSPAIQWRTTFNLKCIFVHSHEHTLWAKIGSIWEPAYSSSTIHPTITFNLKCISVHSHAHSLSKNWLIQHI